MDIDQSRITRKIVIDFLCILSVGLPILIFRLFGQPFKRGFFCNDLTIRYPFHSSTVPDIALYFIGLGLPITVMISFEVALSKNKKNSQSIYLFGRKIPTWAWHCYKVIGVFCFGAVCSQLLTDIGKYSIGRLRPHFMSVCDPDIDCNNDMYKFQYIQYGSFSCQGTDAKLLRESRLSFPSGHSSFSAYTMVYLALYLQAKLRCRSSHLLKHLLQFICITISWATALSRVTDNKHHWSDVLSGLIIGTTVAFLNNWLRIEKEKEIYIRSPPREQIRKRSDGSLQEFDNHQNTSPGGIEVGDNGTFTTSGTNQREVELQVTEDHIFQKEGQFKRLKTEKVKFLRYGSLEDTCSSY